MATRVVITGLGAVTPLGLHIADTWAAMKRGACAVGEITQFDTSAYRVHLACEVKGFDPLQYMERKEARRMDRFCQFAMAAAAQAMEDAGIDMEKTDPYRFALQIGSGQGGMRTSEAESVRLHQSGPSKVNPMLVPMMIVNMAPGHIAMRYGMKGHCSSVVTACATGTNAIGDGFRLIKHGYADLCIAGGAEATITGLGLAGFVQLSAVTERTDPARASIPFDAERDGFVMGEGAGMLILEEYQHAVNRGAKIYAEVLGYGATCDAFHMTAPDPSGEGAAGAMLLALREGGIEPSQVGYINAHGTSTPPNDRVETAAIKRALGEHAYKTAISSTKSMHGHMLGATGAVEAIACAMAMGDEFLPPTIGLKVPDPECDLDYIPGVGRQQKVDYCLSNSMGFGGHNATLLLGRV